MFNLLTYSFLKQINYYNARIDILSNNTNNFKNNDSKRILDSLFLEDNYPNKDFLIDTIDENTFKI